MQLVRDLFDSAHVGGDVLAFRAVAARCGLDQHAAFVANGNGEAVDLGLGGDGQGIIVAKLQEAADTIDEIE